MQEILGIVIPGVAVDFRIDENGNAVSPGVGMSLDEDGLLVLQHTTVCSTSVRHITPVLRMSIAQGMTVQARSSVRRVQPLIYII